MQKVAIVGVEGSGKTVMLAGFGELFSRPDENGYFLAPKNFETATYVTEKIARMRAGEWPTATAEDVMQGVDWTLCWRQEGSQRPRKVCAVSCLDFAGEVYREAFGSRQGNATKLLDEVQQLNTYIKEADYLIVLINLRDIIVNGAQDPRVQESHWITKAILDYAFEARKKISPKGRVEVKAAIVLSQADSYADTIKACGGAKGVVTKYLPHVANNYGWLDIFAVSAVDKTRLDDEGNVVPAPDFKPTGLQPIMEWLQYWCDDAMQLCQNVMTPSTWAPGSPCDSFPPNYGAVVNASTSDYNPAPPSGDRLYRRTSVGVLAGAGVITLLCLFTGHWAWAAFLLVSSCVAAAFVLRNWNYGRLGGLALCLTVAYVVSLMAVAVFVATGVVESELGNAVLAAWVLVRVAAFCAGTNDEFVQAVRAAQAEECSAKAEAGDVDAQCCLGWMHGTGYGVKKDGAEAVTWYRKAAEQGNLTAQNNLGWLYANGCGVAGDGAEAVKWYGRASEQGSEAAQFALGNMYMQGHGIARDYVEAMKWYRLVVEKEESHDVEATCYVGWMYENGLGVAKDGAEALKWYGRAAQKGCLWAQGKVGWMYEQGVGVGRDVKTALENYGRVAENGNAELQFHLGNIYRFGQGCAQDYGMAAKWYLKAAEQGHAVAQCIYGWMRATGCGAVQNNWEAMKWFRKSAKQGNVAAQSNIGWLYATGGMGEPAFAKAIGIYREAAQKGSKTARINLHRLGCDFVA